MDVKKYLFLLISIFLVQTGISFAAESEITNPILSEELVSELTRNCNTTEIFLKAWVANVNMSAVPSDEERKKEEQLKKEITQILRACLEREINKINCSKIGCADVNSGLRELRENIFAKYFLDDKNMWYYTNDYGDKEAWEMYQKKLKECYRKIFVNCGCNIKGLENLWADLSLNDANPFEAPASSDLIQEIEKKIEECMEAKIAEMTNVWELQRLVFEEKRDKHGNRIERVALYNNYNIAKAILKRLVQLYKLENFIDLDDEYFNSNCCDHLLFLDYLFSLIDEYNLMSWPELTKEERKRSAKDYVDFLQKIKVVFKDPDAYTFCRKITFNKLISYGEDCDANKFCQALRCKAPYMITEDKSGQLLFQKEVVKKQLTDPREQEFLNYFKKKMEECSGIDIELEDFVDFCFEFPINKSWENLRKKLETTTKEKEIEKDFEKIDNLKGGNIDIAKLLPITKKATKKIRIILPPEAEFPERDKEEKHLEVKVIDVNDSVDTIREKGVVIELRNNKTFLIEENVEAKVETYVIIKENKIYAGGKENPQAVNLLPNKIKNSLDIVPNTISLKEDENQKPIYIVKLEEKQKLFGFLPLTVKREIEINPSSGKLLRVKQPWWGFLVKKSKIPGTFL